MKDTRIHYPKEPVIFEVIPNVWKSGATMCGKRRDINMITDKPGGITCPLCGNSARAYWTDQKITCERLIQYAEAGKLKGTSAEGEAKSLVPQLRIALFEAIHIIAELPPVVS